jgi:hypothetical protein
MLQSWHHQFCKAWHKDGIQIVNVCHKHTFMLRKDCMGKALVLLVYIILVCKSANAMKQNMLWLEQSSLVGWRQSTSAQAWRIAGCFVRVV